jgi:hypothetical protein
VKFKAGIGSHRPSHDEFAKSLQQQFEAHLKQVHAAPDVTKTVS